MRKLVFFVFLFFHQFEAKAQINDIYHDLKMPRGPHKGQSIFRKTDRPVIRVPSSGLTEDFFESGQDTPVSDSQKEAIILNLFSRPGFHAAKIPLDEIEKVSFLFEEFIPGVAAHTTVWFHFKKDSPVELIAKLPSEKEWAQGKRFIPTETPVKTRDLIFSVDANGVTGGFNPIKGLKKDQYTSIWRFLTAESYSEAYFMTRPFPVTQRELNLNSAEAKAYLIALINKSADLKLDGSFCTNGGNCTDQPFEVLKEVNESFQNPRNESTAGMKHKAVKATTPVLGWHPFFMKSLLEQKGFLKEGAANVNFEHDPDVKELFMTSYNSARKIADRGAKSGKKKAIQLQKYLDKYERRGSKCETVFAPAADL